MRYSRAFQLWTNPEWEMPEIFHHLSYILFRTDSEEAQIVAVRCPDPAGITAGASLIDVLQLDAEAQVYLFGGNGNRPPLVVMTAVGLGVLDMRYDGHAGLGVYWHIHGRPDGLARLVNSGVLGDPNGGTYRISRAVAAVNGEILRRDAPSYHALADGWGALDRPAGQWATCDGNGRLYGTELCDFVSKLAEFAGCGWLQIQRDEHAGRIKCRRPVLLEALLLCLLTEVSTYASVSEAVCRVGTLGHVDEEGLALELAYPLEKADKYCDRLEAIHRHLGWVCELGGLELHAEVVPLRRGERQAGKLPQMRITLEWLHDPVVLSTSDLKAKIRFFYENC